MERLQWWLLLLSAVMFSMSGCATLEDWHTWSGNPAHFASVSHLAFSVKSHPTSVSITEADTAAAAREEWWGRLVPEDPAFTKVVAKTVVAKAMPTEVEGMDMTGRWRGHWVADGVWGDRRESDAEMVFVQYGTKGTGRLKLGDTVAAVGVPEIVRYFGSFGMPMNYRISGGEVLARYEDGPAVLVRFTRVGNRIFGRVAASPSFLLVLDRQ
jgi:hypothetical protein